MLKGSSGSFGRGRVGETSGVLAGTAGTVWRKRTLGKSRKGVRMRSAREGMGWRGVGESKGMCGKSVILIILAFMGKVLENPTCYSSVARTLHVSGLVMSR